MSLTSLEVQSLADFSLIPLQDRESPHRYHLFLSKFVSLPGRRAQRPPFYIPSTVDNRLLYCFVACGEYSKTEEDYSYTLFAVPAREPMACGRREPRQAS
jgi:hypothetical protein